MMFEIFKVENFGLRFRGECARCLQKPPFHTFRFSLRKFFFQKNFNFQLPDLGTMIDSVDNLITTETISQIQQGKDAFDNIRRELNATIANNIPTVTGALRDAGKLQIDLRLRISNSRFMHFKVRVSKRHRPKSIYCSNGYQMLWATIRTIILIKRTTTFKSTTNTFTTAVLQLVPFCYSYYCASFWDCYVEYAANVRMAMVMIVVTREPAQDS